MRKLGGCYGQKIASPSRSGSLDPSSLRQTHAHELHIWLSGCLVVCLVVWCLAWSGLGRKVDLVVRKSNHITMQSSSPRSNLLRGPWPSNLVVHGPSQILRPGAAWAAGLCQTDRQTDTQTGLNEFCLSLVSLRGLGWHDGLLLYWTLNVLFFLPLLALAYGYFCLLLGPRGHDPSCHGFATAALDHKQTSSSSIFSRSTYLQSMIARTKTQ